MSALPAVAIFRILLVSKNCRFFKRDVSKLSIFLLRCASCLTKRVFRCAWEIMGDAWECLRNLHRGRKWKVIRTVEAVRLTSG